MDAPALPTYSSFAYSASQRSPSDGPIGQRTAAGLYRLETIEKISLWSKNTGQSKVWAKVWAGIFF
jgi:hypothetical protein